MIWRGRFSTADLKHLGASLLLPWGVGGEEHRGPGEEESCGLVAGEEESLAFVHEHLEVEAETSSLLLGLGQKHPQEVVAIRTAPSHLYTVFPALYYLHQQPLHFHLQRFNLSVVLTREEPERITNPWVVLKLWIELNILNHLSHSL